MSNEFRKIVSRILTEDPWDPNVNDADLEVSAIDDKFRRFSVYNPRKHYLILHTGDDVIVGCENGNNEAFKLDVPLDGIYLDRDIFIQAEKTIVEGRLVMCKHCEGPCDLAETVLTRYQSDTGTERCGNCRFVYWEDGDEYAGYHCGCPYGIRYEKPVASNDHCGLWMKIVG